MSIFDSNIKNTVITADKVKEVIRSRESFDCAFETHPEEKLEEIISSVAECIYYRCKAGDYPYDGWEFKESVFGLSFKNPFLDPDSLYEEKRHYIIQYILNRFEELGYAILYNESKKCFEIKILGLYKYESYFSWGNFSHNYSMKNELVNLNIINSPKGKVYYMDFPANDIGVAGVDNGYTDIVDDCSTP